MDLTMAVFCYSSRCNPG